MSMPTQHSYTNRKRRKFPLRDRYQRGLEFLGYRPVPCVSGKYIAFRHPEKPSQIVFLGASGAVRVGRTASTSVNTLDSFKQGLLIFSRRGTAAPTNAERKEQERLERKCNPQSARISARIGEPRSALASRLEDF